MQRSGKRNFTIANQSRSPIGERLKMGLMVQEAEMNNYPSSIFSTVFFVVILFIGMGVLGYHAYEITVENLQLNEDVKTLQMNMTSLSTENVALKAENLTLQTENAAFSEESNELKAALAKEIAENTSLRAAEVDKLAELEKLHRENSELKAENLKLKTIGSNNVGSNQNDIEGFQSSLLPTDLKPWLNVVITVLIAAFLLIIYARYKLTQDKRQKSIASPVAVGKRQPTILESRFIRR